MTLRKEKLEPFKTDLMARRDALARDLRKSTEDLIEDESTFADSVDQAAADTDKTILVHIKNRDRGILTQIDEALRRIETGVFGDCEECGELIAEPRLRANPATTLCIDCKAALESEQNRFIPGRI